MEQVQFNRVALWIKTIWATRTHTYQVRSPTNLNINSQYQQNIFKTYLKHFKTCVSTNHPLIPRAKFLKILILEFLDYKKKDHMSLFWTHWYRKHEGMALFYLICNNLNSFFFSKLFSQEYNRIACDEWAEEVLQKKGGTYMIDGTILWWMASLHSINNILKQNTLTRPVSDFFLPQ